MDSPSLAFCAALAFSSSAKLTLRALLAYCVEEKEDLALCIVAGLLSATIDSFGVTGNPPLEVSPVVAPDWEEAGESRVRDPPVTNDVGGRGTAVLAREILLDMSEGDIAGEAAGSEDGEIAGRPTIGDDTGGRLMLLFDLEDLAGDVFWEDVFVWTPGIANEARDAKELEDCFCLIAVRGSSSLLSLESLSLSAKALEGFPG